MNASGCGGRGSYELGAVRKSRLKHSQDGVMLRGMKLILAAAFFGVLLGAAIFISSQSASQPTNAMLQSSVLPQAKPAVTATRVSQNEWPTAIAFSMGGLFGFGAFLIAKRRA